MRILTTLLVSTFFIGGIAFSANAQDLVTTKACTVVEGETVATEDDAWKYCDIHMRQFQHRERIIELKDSLNTRAENFKMSTKPVIDAYKQALQEYHNNMGSDSQ